tara:strand:+ start:127 stop:249 length:123 start_codon:yes stop_codon:yes gene_type:complete
MKDKNIKNKHPSDILIEMINGIKENRGNLIKKEQRENKDD